MNDLAKALENRWLEAAQGLVHHSDQGVQYASKYYGKLQEKAWDKAAFLLKDAH
jgi:hypothetical protein